MQIQTNRICLNNIKDGRCQILHNQLKMRSPVLHAEKSEAKHSPCANRRYSTARKLDTTVTSRFSAKSVSAQRKRLGISANDFGKLVGVSGVTIYAWEQGRSRPRKAQIQALGLVRTLGKTEARAKLGKR